MRAKLFLLSVLAAICLAFAGCEGPETIRVTGVEVTPATLTLDIGDTHTLSAEVTHEEADDTTVIWSTDAPAIAEVDTQTGEVTAKAEGTAKITATTTDGGKTDDCIVTVNPENVLINGVRWAMSNVDAPGTFAAAPEDFGMYYQWGRNVGWSVTDPLVSSDGDEVWDTTEYDGDEWLAANDPCPAGWRVPTNDEFIALCNTDEVANIWTEQDGVAGHLFTDITTDKSIFLPAAGRSYNNIYGSGSVDYPGTYGHYWSSTPYGWYNMYNLDVYLAQFLLFDSGGYAIPSFKSASSDGNSVRCVRR